MSNNFGDKSDKRQVGTLNNTLESQELHFPLIIRFAAILEIGWYVIFEQVKWWKKIFLPKIKLQETTEKSLLGQIKMTTLIKYDLKERMLTSMYGPL